MGNSVNNINASNEISRYIASSTTFEEMHAFQKQYRAMVEEYDNTPSLKLMSTIEAGKLKSFKCWAPQALENKDKVMPLLVSNMLKGNIFSVSIYDSLYELDNKPDLIIDYMKLHKDPDLKEQFHKHGGGEDSRAILSAEHWLQSHEAADIFNSSNAQLSLCAVNDMLHITNEFLHC
ncbi:MAG: hypothetical protein ACHP6I_01155 [Rickettsiales bacterium]